MDLGDALAVCMAIRDAEPDRFEPGLREEITAATNKAEAFNGFSAWLRFGHDTIERNDRADRVARWDRAHLCLFELADATDVCGPIEWEDPLERSVFAGATRVSRLSAGEQFLYTFDMGDDWTHLCTVAEQRIDPLQALGIIPAGALAYWGWGEIPRPVRPAQRKPTTANPAPTRSRPVRNNGTECGGRPARRSIVVRRGHGPDPIFVRVDKDPARCVRRACTSQVPIVG